MCSNSWRITKSSFGKQSNEYECNNIDYDYWIVNFTSKEGFAKPFVVL